MNQQEINAVLNLPKEKLYETFLLRIADYNEVWVLDDDGILLYGDENDNTIFPIWPEQEFAQLCAKDDWHNAIPVAIDLEEFLFDFVPDLIQSQTPIAIFPRPNESESLILSAEEFALHVADYLADNYGIEMDLPYLS